MKPYRILIAALAVTSCHNASADTVETLPPHYTETTPATQIEFDMTRVPGDKAKGIKSFCIGTREVTGDTFMPWVMQDDGEDVDERIENRAMKPCRTRRALHE